MRASDLMVVIFVMTAIIIGVVLFIDAKPKVVGIYNNVKTGETVYIFNK